MKKNKKSNKKQLILIFLFLFAISGVIGFGAYSYYWTQGSYETEEETINIIAFDPEVYNHGSQFFLGNGGTIPLSCGTNSSNGHETITCTGDATIFNYGGTDITLEVENESVDVSYLSGVDVDYSGATFELGTTTLSPNEQTTITVTVPLVIDNGTTSGDGGYEPVQVSAPVSGGEFTVSANFKLKATQVQ